MDISNRIHIPAVLHLMLALLATSHGTAINSNRTLGSSLSNLLSCASTANDMSKIDKWFSVVFQKSTLENLSDERLCEEKWLNCLSLPPETLPGDRYVIRLLLKHLNLCSEPSVANLTPESELSSRSLVLIALVLLFNLTALTGGFWIYVYRSDCKLRFRNDVGH